MAPGIKILNGVSDWIRNSVGPEAANRADDEPVDDEETAEAEEENGESSDYDAPACCSAASSTDVTVLDP